MLVRQRPGTAKGVIFMTLEDETGVANIIVWPKVFERLRAIVIGARFVAVTGKLQNEAGVIHVVVERMEDLTPMLGMLSRRRPRPRSLRARRRGAPRAADHAAEAPGRPLRASPTLRGFAPRSVVGREPRARARAAGGEEFSLSGPTFPDAGGGEKADLSPYRRACFTTTPASAVRRASADLSILQPLRACTILSP